MAERKRREEILVKEEERRRQEEREAWRRESEKEEEDEETSNNSIRSEGSVSLWSQGTQAALCEWSRGTLTITFLTPARQVSGCTPAPARSRGRARQPWLSVECELRRK